MSCQLITNFHFTNAEKVHDWGKKTKGLKTSAGVSV